MQVYNHTISYWCMQPCAEILLLRTSNSAVENVSFVLDQNNVNAGKFYLEA